MAHRHPAAPRHARVLGASSPPPASRSRQMTGTAPSAAPPLFSRRGPSRLAWSPTGRQRRDRRAGDGRQPIRAPASPGPMRSAGQVPDADPPQVERADGRHGLTLGHDHGPTSSSIAILSTSAARHQPERAGSAMKGGRGSATGSAGARVLTVRPAGPLR